MISSVHPLPPGAALLSCRQCGTAIPMSGGYAQHNRWHEGLNILAALAPHVADLETRVAALEAAAREEAAGG